MKREVQKEKQLIQKTLLIFSFVAVSFAAAFHLADSTWYIILGNIVARALALFVLLNVFSQVSPIIFSRTSDASVAKRIGVGILQVPLVVLATLTVM